MKLLRSISLLLCIYLFYGFQKPAEQYDICIYGATSAGVIAAYSAAKMGKKVILLDPGSHVGGLSSGGLGYTDIGNKYAISGLALDFYRRMGQHYGKFEQWIFEPHVADSLFRDYLERAGLKVFFHHRLNKVEKNNETIQQIIVEDHTTSSEIKTKSYSAKVFMDCSYEGDLMAMAGVSYTVGRESNKTYNETYNGVQLMDGHQFPDGVDPYKKQGDRTSGLLWGISNENLEQTGSGDKKLQAFNFRICLTSDPINRLPVIRPEGYDSSRYELLLRLFDKQPDKRTLNDYFIISKMPNAKTDINNRGGFSTDMIGMNYDYPETNFEKRSDIVKQHELYVKGLLYFYGNDKRVPEKLRNEMLQYGYPKDEYINNGHWSPQLYIRESRRMIGQYVMTQSNCEGKEIVRDGVGIAAYTMDSHNCQRIVVNGMVKNEGNVEVGGFDPYPVSYRSIIPNKDECNNLFVPVCLSASHIAYGSIRMEPVFMVLAQSAAVAASMAIDKNQKVHLVDVKKVQEFLNRNPMLDGSTPEALVDNDDKTRVKTVGDWEEVKVGGYGRSYLRMKNSAGKGRSIKFTPGIRVNGTYDVYAYYLKDPDASNITTFTIHDGKKSHEVSINKSDVAVEGQTSGEWVKLGSFELTKGQNCYVSISDKKADGVINADAILFVPQK